jgi:hypothetical protein
MGEGEAEGKVMSFAAAFLIFCIVALCIPVLQRAIGAVVLAILIALVAS